MSRGRIQLAAPVGGLPVSASSNSAGGTPAATVRIRSAEIEREVFELGWIKGCSIFRLRLAS